MVMALWSEGPAPPRRPETPRSESASRKPSDWRSVIRLRLVEGTNFTGVMVCIRVAPGGGLAGSGQRRLRRVAQHEAEQFGPRVMADAVHHPLALDDQRHVEIGDHQAFAFAARRRQMHALGRDDGGVAAVA